MNTLNATQNAKLARACTAVRLAIKNRISLKQIREMLNGDAKKAAFWLGLTVANSAGVTSHDLDDSRVVWHLVDCISTGRTKADTMLVLKNLRDECHAAIDRANA
ncbi:TPA: hypothetical protein QHN36_003528 [Enterobacter bugandensis]|nr:hypothetical protein [Enterobacter bugandensis]